MAEYEQKYLLNKSGEETTVNNKQTLVPNIPLTPLVDVTELTLTGMTYNSDIQPIGGVRIVLYDSEGNAVAETVTSLGTETLVLGAYLIKFGGTLGETYRIVASADGYFDATDEVTFDTTVKSRSFKLITDPGIKTIYGTVKGEDGIGLGGAAVVITKGTENVVVVLSEDDGAYIAYDDFEEGVTYTVTANLLGYDSASAQVTFSGGENIVNVNLVLSERQINFTNIIGTIVVVGTTSPIPHAFVGLYRINDGVEELIRTTLTNEIGRYSFSNVAAGETYIVRALKIEPV
ncbi:carboxypeptidase-like regulatory domain-containing protein [Clostridium sp. SM-530-WT-3G]|uniref:carboxypeptidase-like regulatory domain-containing protein n=1 Tax=Clostridium sp. SM-530-WT-3G TaxID=2725303 RepID=UPI00145EEDEF|nr:carboxypeptidase-like regulatory domain-containing protein [Clostridium sp. SM-530-WT-3G]NME84179.1 carboxypeptidase regulatory-like domain-containing protein [Clostridium sp. SM-530-WT-3G]